MSVERLNLWCFCSSWYLVSGMHYGRAAEGKSPFSWHWLYPLSAWLASTAICSFSPLLAPAFHYLSKVPCGRGFALQSQAFLTGRCINREKWGMKRADDKRLNYLGCCIRYLRAEPKRIWFADLCVLWDLLPRKELLPFSSAQQVEFLSLLIS